MRTEIMRSVTLIILLAFVIPGNTDKPAINHMGDAQDSMDNEVDRRMSKLVSKLFDEVLRQTDLDDTTLGKPGRLAVPSSRSAPLSALQGRSLPTSSLSRPSYSQCPYPLEGQRRHQREVGKQQIQWSSWVGQAVKQEAPPQVQVPGSESGKPVILHLAGSRASEYYEGVSIIYGGECLNSVADFGKYRNLPCFVNLDGTWSFPEDTSDEARAKAERVTFAQAMEKIAELKPDAIVPHMFCLPGMTSFRGLFDTMGIPLVGNPADVMALSEDKWKTRAIVSASGVKVPNAEILRKGEGKLPTLKPPFLLKPLREANSQGISMVQPGDDVQQALDKAFSFDSEVLAEEFIPLGREMRVAGLEMEDGSVKMLPGVEYFLTKEAPIRTADAKLLTDDRGVPTDFAPVDRKCPADIDEVLAGKLQDLVQRSHKALGCRDYSLYDVRIDPEGEPYFIEACLYCSFAPKSVIVLMGAGSQPPLEQKYIYEMLVDRAIERGKAAAAARSQGQVLGMNR